MWRTAIGLFLAVPLPFPFGDADATALVIEDDGSAVLEVTVDVAGSPAVVLVRGIGLVDELPPVALAPQGDGIWAGVVHLNTTNGVLLGFEYIPSGGGSATLTNLYTLVELGVDPAALTRREPTTTSTGGVGPSTTEVTAVLLPEQQPDSRWAWLALAAGSGGLALLMVWLWLGAQKADADVSDDAGAVAANAHPTTD